MNTRRAVDSNELAIGDLLQIDIDRTKQVSTYVEMIHENTIWTADIMVDIWNYSWRRRAFDATFLRNGRCFSFMVEIQGRETVKNLAYTRMARISSVKEIQRRSSFRLLYDFDVYIKEYVEPILKSERDTKKVMEEIMKNDLFAPKTDLSTYHKCKGLDLSETGLGFVSDVEWKPGSELECLFVIDKHEYKFKAKVMRRFRRTEEERPNPEDPFVYKIGIMFDSDDEHLLKNIRKFVFKEQLARKE